MNYRALQQNCVCIAGCCFFLYGQLKYFKSYFRFDNGLQHPFSLENTRRVIRQIRYFSSCFNVLWCHSLRILQYKNYKIAKFQYLLFSKPEAMLYIIGGYIVYISLYVLSRQIISKGLLYERYLGKIPLATFGSFTGFQSGITGLCIKSSVELIKTQCQGQHNFDYHPTAFFLPVSALISVFLHLFFLNAGLKYYAAMQMVPIVQSSMIVYNILTGGIVLKEFDTFNDKSKICFPLGTIICCLGIFIIMFKNRKDRSFQNSAKEAQIQKFESEQNDSIRSEKIELENSNSLQQSKEIVELHHVIIENYLTKTSDSENISTKEKINQDAEESNKA